MKKPSIREAKAAYRSLFGSTPDDDTIREDLAAFKSMKQRISFVLFLDILYHDDNQ